MEKNVADYIFMPVKPARFVQAIDKAREILESNSEEVKMNQEEFVFIKDSNTACDRVSLLIVPTQHCIRNNRHKVSKQLKAA